MGPFCKTMVTNFCSAQESDSDDDHGGNMPEGGSGAAASKSSKFEESGVNHLQQKDQTGSKVTLNPSQKRDQTDLKDRKRYLEYGW